MPSPLCCWVAGASTGTPSSSPTALHAGFHGHSPQAAWADVKPARPTGQARLGNLPSTSHSISHLESADGETISNMPKVEQKWLWQSSTYTSESSSVSAQDHSFFIEKNLHKRLCLTEVVSSHLFLFQFCRLLSRHGVEARIGGDGIV